jgi:glutamate synthase (NADPH) small chain
VVPISSKKVICLYRRDEASMPGSRNMVRWTREEGVRLEFLTAPVRFLGDGSKQLKAIECTRMSLSEPEETGRRLLKPAGSHFVLESDFAVLAFGFSSSPLPCPDADLALNAAGSYEVDGNHMTSMRGVFAGGSLTQGAGLVVTAVRDGRDAAEAMDRFLAAAPQALGLPIPAGHHPDIRRVSNHPPANAPQISAVLPGIGAR